MAKPKAPKDLLVDGSALWASIVQAYDLRLDELAVLASICRATDRITLMREQLGRMSLMVLGSMGQDTINPLVAEIRAHEAQIAGLFAKLKLPDDSNVEKENRSTQARAAVNARWAKRGA